MIKREISEYGTVTYRLNGTLHRPNGPASTWLDTQFWYLYGENHRYYGPARNILAKWVVHGKVMKGD